MQIGIIGAGRLGSALGQRLAGAGHQIMYGGGESARIASKRQDAVFGSNAEAVAFGEIVVLAVPFDAIDQAISDAGSLTGCVLWSCVNALKADLSGLVVGFDTSAAEEVARRAAGARVVAAIPPFASALAAEGPMAYDAGLRPSVFVCGEDAAAKMIVARLVGDLAADAVDVGGLAAARFIEPALLLLVRIAYCGSPRDVGIRLLER
jgi:predicted dinucleotide-binding enzyme